MALTCLVETSFVGELHCCIDLSPSVSRMPVMLLKRMKSLNSFSDVRPQRRSFFSANRESFRMSTKTLMHLRATTYLHYPCFFPQGNIPLSVQTNSRIHLWRVCRSQVKLQERTEGIGELNTKVDVRKAKYTQELAHVNCIL